MKTITLSDKVSSINTGAFRNCDSITDVYYCGDENQWKNLEVKGYNESHTGATIHYNSHNCVEWKVTKVPSTNAEGEETSTCSICGDTTTRSIPKLNTDNPFGDISQGAYYYDAVLWAVNHKPQITNGTSPSSFSPDNTCTRAQVVTFLYRAAGEPEVKNKTNPFTDVKPGDYYYNAVLWAVENGITKGLNETTFGSNESCTRAQVVTFLYRTAGEPEGGYWTTKFSDVDLNAYYGKAVMWAVMNGITKGTTNTTFSPDDTCTRGQIVTFLYRAYTLIQ